MGETEKIQKHLRTVALLLEAAIQICPATDLVGLLKAADGKITELCLTIDRLKRGEGDLPEANRASQESGS